uniref:Putative secreted protein n=1 Tax=Ixodes ricinus TaxID=34613 RepID=A0A6B0UJE9_IXORI
MFSAAVRRDILAPVVFGILSTEGVFARRRQLRFCALGPAPAADTIGILGKAGVDAQSLFGGNVLAPEVCMGDLAHLQGACHPPKAVVGVALLQSRDHHLEHLQGALVHRL